MVMQYRKFSFFFILFMFLGTGSVQAQHHTKSKILWLTLDEAFAKSKEEKRKILMFLYTDWCAWCKRMESMTLENTVIADYINRNYYPVKFNAEEKEPVKFKDKSYTFVSLKPRGVHGLAMEMMKGRISYPTITFFDEDWEVIQSLPNFQPPHKFEQIITYFAGNYYKKIPWSSYEQTYQFITPPTKN